MINTKNIIIMKRNFTLFCFLCALIVSFCGCQHEKLPTVYTTEVSDITGTSALSGGTVVDDGTEVTMRGVCYSTTNNLPNVNDDVITVDGDGAGEYFSKLENLTPNTLYYVRAYAMNSVGTAYGETVSFRTKDINDDDTLINETIRLLCRPDGWVLAEATCNPALQFEDGSYSNNLLEGFIQDYERDDIITFHYNGYFFQSIRPGILLPNENEPGYTEELAYFCSLDEQNSGWIFMQIPFFYDETQEHCRIITLDENMFKIECVWSNDGLIKENYTFYLTYVPANR